MTSFINLKLRSTKSDLREVRVKTLNLTLTLNLIAVSPSLTVRRTCPSVVVGLDPLEICYELVVSLTFDILDQFDLIFSPFGKLNEEKHSVSCVDPCRVRLRHTFSLMSFDNLALVPLASVSLVGIASFRQRPLSCLAVYVSSPSSTSLVLLR